MIISFRSKLFAAAIAVALSVFACTPVTNPGTTNQDPATRKLTLNTGSPGQSRAPGTLLSSIEELTAVSPDGTVISDITPADGFTLALAVDETWTLYVKAGGVTYPVEFSNLSRILRMNKGANGDNSDLDLGSLTLTNGTASSGTLDPDKVIDNDQDGVNNDTDTDDDGDKTPDATDNDKDGDGADDHFAEIDSDNDGTPDVKEYYLDKSLAIREEGKDGDKIPDLFDEDDDGDKIADTEDTDDDNDGTLDTDDAFAKLEIKDSDGDKIPDIRDKDDDNDGTADITDSDADGNGSMDTMEHDTDFDGTPDVTDTDDDGDGTADAEDSDIDGDGTKDAEEPDFKDLEHDFDGDGVENDKDTDDDNDGTVDAKDVDSDGDGKNDSTKEPMPAPVKQTL